MDLAFDAAWENDTVIDAGADRPTSPVIEKQESYVGQLPQEREDIHARRHMVLIGQWSDLRDRMTAIQSWDASIKAAAQVLEVRVAEIAHAAGLLCRVSSASRDISLADEFADDAPLAAYLAGAYLWLDGVVPTLATLAKQLGEGTPDWSSFRERLENVSWLFEATEREQMSVDTSWLPAQLANDVRSLFVAIDAVRVGVSQPFG